MNDQGTILVTVLTVSTFVVYGLTMATVMFILQSKRHTKVGHPNNPAFTCPICGVTSYHPDDLENNYCARCHRFIDPKGSTP